LHDLEAIALQMLMELRAIRELLERRGAGENNLLAVIHSATRGLAFTTSELARHAALPANSDLAAALAREFAVPNPRRIGRFLAAASGRQTGIFIVEALGQERDGALWRVRPSASLPGQTRLPVAREENAVMLVARRK
jgi:hypothetical protein